MQEQKAHRTHESVRRALLAALPALALLGCGANETSPETESMRVTRVLRDLVTALPELEVVRAHPEKAPFVDVICPASNYGRDGADMLSLVLAPPAEVRFTIPDEAGPCVLRMRAGVDITAAKLFSGEISEGAFRFQVQVDGDAAFEGDVLIRAGLADAGSEWLDVGGEDGLAVLPGQTITLKTSAVGPDGPLEGISAVAYAVPAIEIVGSRIANWDIKLVDPIADDASSGLFVLGARLFVLAQALLYVAKVRRDAGLRRLDLMPLNGGSSGLGVLEGDLELARVHVGLDAVQLELGRVVGGPRRRALGRRDGGPKRLHVRTTL